MANPSLKIDSVRTMNPAEPDPRLHFQYGRGTVYENETAIARTLDALCPESELVCHDQRMFQILHLNTELAWYNIHYELREVIRLLGQRSFPEAQRLTERASLLSRMPLAALQTMIESMSQVSLLKFRAQLPANATGIDSPGMINLRHISRLLWASFEEALESIGHTPVSLATLRVREARLSEPLEWPARIFDAIQQFDVKLMEWKQLHLRLVWTHLGGAIASMQSAEAESASAGGCPMGGGAPPGDGLPEGVMPTSLRGRPISALQKITVTPLFPKLWRIPDLVYEEMTRSGAVY